jgi:hypothetical protein
MKFLCPLVHWDTLGWWVRIPLKTWMFVCVYSVFYRYRPCNELILVNPLKDILEILCLRLSLNSVEEFQLWFKLGKHNGY